MNKITTYCLVGLSLLGMASCSEEEVLNGSENGSIRLSVVAEQAEEQPVSRALPASFDVDELWVSLYRGDYLYQESNQVSAWTNTSLSVPAASNYRMVVQSCTETEAESLNDGKGAMRLLGESGTFSIAAREEKTLEIVCSMANAAVTASFDGAADCSLTLQAVDDADRVFTLTPADASSYYYFNVSNTRTLRFTVAAGSNQLTGSVTVSAKDVCTLQVRGTSADDSTVTVEVNGEITEVISANDTFNPYDD